MEITGRITKDATLAKIGKDRQVVNFSIAVNDSYKPNGASEIKKIVTYINCSYWLSPNISQYLKKGALVQIVGRIGLSLYLNNSAEACGNLTFHVNQLKILVFTKKENSSINSLTVITDSQSKENTDDLPF